MDPADTDADQHDGSPFAEVARSARGWHGVQLGVLAFIGLCGVLSDADSGNPRWLQILAGVLAIVALVVSCLSIFVVASVAWPTRTTPSGATPSAAARRLRIGVLLTYVAVGVMALAASSSWWPTKAADDGAGAGAGGVAIATVAITDTSGRTACGQLVDGPAGRIRLATAAGTVELAASGLASIAPTDTC